ncbi:MAG: rhodanese-like domain-containing protein [Planctomycetota bacterium]
MKSRTNDWGASIDGPLCGIYATARGLRALGIECSIDQFIKRRYVSKCGGSTEQDIVEMVESTGAAGVVLGRLSIFDLRLADRPFVANVRSSPVDERYDHWITVIPNDRNFLVLDGIDEPRMISAAEFSAIWRGAGVFIAKDAGLQQIVVLGRVMLLTALIAFGITVWNLAERILPRFTDPIKHGRNPLLSLAMASLFCFAMGLSAFGDVHRFRLGLNAAVAHVSTDLKTCSLEHLLNATDDENAIVIDARRFPDFERGSLSNAVSFPVNASYWAVQEKLSDVPRDTSFIVYCQSKYCEYDTTVAKRLRSFGFYDVTVSDAGWREANESTFDESNRHVLR